MTSCLKLDRVGRDGHIAARFARRQERTVLAASSYRQPLQILAPLALEDGAAYQMLLHPAGGVVAGDRLQTEIELEAETHVCLTTPAATRIYRAAADNNAAAPAELTTAIRVGGNAVLEYVPEAVIPHAGAYARQSLRLDLAPGARALVWDAMASGRVEHGERWQFRELDASVAVYRDGRPIYLSRSRILPGALPPTRLGVMEQYDYAATWALFAESDPRAWIAALREELAALAGVHGGVSALGCGGCLARLLAVSADALAAAGQRLWALSRRLVLNLAPLDVRKY